VNEANQTANNDPIVPASPFPVISNTRSQRISQVNLNGTPATATAALRRQNSSSNTSNTQTLATIEETSEGSGVDEQDSSAVSVPGNVPQQTSPR
jgi:hypothetical protein